MKKLGSLYVALFFASVVFGQNVGIGTSTPSATLDVNGTFKLADGTQGAGKVLTSDASGLASWESASSSYPCVTICCQTWMTKNLDVSTYRNGDAIPKVTSNTEWAALTTGAYCYYNNDSATYAAIYGKIYNWYAVNDSRGLAPEGWHIPSDFEWTTLANCLGGYVTAGGPMKEIGTTHWASPNFGATNISNFTALPGGFRSGSGTFGDVTAGGVWWSSTAKSTTNAWYRTIYYYDEGLEFEDSSFHTGYSVRCIRDY